jgi:hypothetical protein
MKKGSHHMLALGLLMTVQLFAANAHDETSHQTIMALKPVGFWGIAGGSEGGINLCLRRDALVDVISDGRPITLEELTEVSVDDRRRALEQLESRQAGAFQQMSQALLPILTMGLKSPQTYRVAASLLTKLDTDQSKAALSQALPILVQAMQTEDRPRQERVEAVLALIEMGAMVKDAVAPLVGLLEGIDKREGVRLPRVEDLLRNVVMRALLDIDPGDEGARAGLGSARARPIFASLYLKQSYLDDVRPLVEVGRYMEALDIYRTLPLQEHDDRFISQGDPHRDNRGESGNIRAYTATAHRDGGGLAVPADLQMEEHGTSKPGSRLGTTATFLQLYQGLGCQI